MVNLTFTPVGSVQARPKSMLRSCSLTSMFRLFLGPPPNRVTPRPSLGGR